LGPGTANDQPDDDHVSPARRLPAISASTPSWLSPSRQSSGILSPEFHRLARAPDPIALGAPLPDAAVDSACLLDLASLPTCVHPSQMPAQLPGSDSHRPITSLQSQ